MLTDPLESIFSLKPKEDNLVKMENLTLQLISVSAIFLSTFLSTLLPLKVIGTTSGSSSGASKSERFISVCNCLAGGVFLTTCFLGLIPSAHQKFDHIRDTMSAKNTYPITEAVVLAGFYMILILERTVSAVREFGWKKDNSYLFEMDQLLPHHSGQQDSSESEDEIDLFEMQPIKHSSHKENGKVGSSSSAKKANRNWDSGHSHTQNVSSQNLGRSFILLLALSVHSVFEGMALGVQENQKNTLYLLAAILIHETLAGFALGSNMVRNGTSACLLCFYSSVFSVMIPIGIVIGLAINGNKSFPAEVASATTQALAAGVFIFITFFEIFGHEFDKQQDWLLKVIASLIGFLLLAGLEAILIFKFDTL